MAKGGALDLASGLGGKIQKDDVLEAVDKYFLFIYTYFLYSIYMCLYN